MAEAKIDIVTAVQDEGLKNLNAALADGQQKVKALKTELKNLEKETQNGTKATNEQKAALRDLQQQLNEQVQTNKQYAKAISDATKSYKEHASAASSAGGVFSELGTKLKGVTDTSNLMAAAVGGISGALASMAAGIAESVVSALSDLATSFLEAGANAQTIGAHFDAMKTNVDDAVTSYRVFNDLTRDLTYDPSTLESMMTQLMSLGYSAQNAADLIRQCADAAAGLGQGASGAQQLVTVISRIQATGEATAKQITSLKMAGINLDEAFSSLGMSGAEAMEAMENGTLSASDAVGALSNYMDTFKGSMNTTKENINDAWGDVTGNLAACCEEIGLSILNAFSQSEIVQELIDFTQNLLDMIRSDGVSIFSDFGAVASYALSLVGDALAIVINAIKLVIMAGHEMYAAFRSLGSRIATALAPILQPLGEIWRILSGILSSLGHQISEGIDAGWNATFTSSAEPSTENHFNPTPRKAAASGGASGSSSGGRSSASASNENREEQRQIDALIQKYTDAEKQKQALAKSSLELAKANANMLVGENKKAEENKIALQGLSDAHDALISGYEKELGIAQKIEDAEIRDDVTRSIKEQISAENALYEAKVKAQEFQAQYSANQSASKKLLDDILGNKDEVTARIQEIKANLQEALSDIDIATANPDDEEALTGMAKLLNVSTDDLIEELETKGETLQQFAEQYKQTLAETAAAETEQLTVGQQWSTKMASYATEVGKSMASAMTDFILGSKTAKEALQDFVKNIISSAVSILTEWLAVFAIYSAFPMIAGDMSPADAANKTVFGITKKRAMGGLVRGAGSSTSDSIPTMLSNGEYVIRSSAVDKIGTSNLDALNAGKIPDALAGESTHETTNNNVTLQVSAMDSSSFMDFLRNGGMDSIKQMLYDGNRDFTTAAGVW